MREDEFWEKTETEKCVRKSLGRKRQAVDKRVKGSRGKIQSEKLRRVIIISETFEKPGKRRKVEAHHGGAPGDSAFYWSFFSTGAAAALLRKGSFSSRTLVTLSMWPLMVESWASMGS